jgi:solute carrier family 44 protein 1 (choline transporter-like protein)
MTIDTIFMCFCEDCERNDGVNSPYFMSKDLMVGIISPTIKHMSKTKHRQPVPTIICL